MSYLDETPEEAQERDEREEYRRDEQEMVTDTEDDGPQIENRTLPAGVGFRIYSETHETEFVWINGRPFMGIRSPGTNWTSPMSVDEPERFGPSPAANDTSSEAQEIGLRWVKAFFAELPSN